MSWLFGGVAGSSTLSVPVIVGGAIGGAAAAAILATAGTQIAQSVTQPSQTTANTSQVNQPHYAD